MFGSQPNIHKYEPLSPQFRQIHANTNQLQFFASLFDTNQITFLDPHKIYCIIQTERYVKIKEELKNSLKNQQSLQKTAYEMNLANIGLNQEVKIFRQQLEKLRHNQQKLIKEYQQTSNACKNYQKALIDLKSKSNQNLFSFQPPSKRILPTKTFTNEECQTEALLSNQEEANLVSIKSKGVIQAQVEVAQQRLYQLLKAEMQKFQQEFENKIYELQEAKLNIQKWSAENAFLREQNEHLRQKIIQRDIEEQKLKIWKESIYGFVSRVQHSITHPSSKQTEKQLEEQSNEEVHRLKQEVLDLRGRIVEMRNKVKRIDDLMEFQGEITDDGAIGMLVRSTQKLKQLIKGMILQVEQI